MRGMVYRSLLLCVSCLFIVGNFTIKQANIRTRYTAVVAEDGTVWTWGHGAFGQLGVNSRESSRVPVRVLGLPHTATAVSCGAWHMAALVLDCNEAGVGAGESVERRGRFDGNGRGDMSLWMWGNNDHGQLGIGNSSSSLVPREVCHGQLSSHSVVSA
jgi:alpha-tubulin suppressor-like RCC1 family protein